MRWPTPLLCVDLTQMRAARADPARILKHGTVGCGFETMTPKPSAVSTQRNKRRKPSALCKYERSHLCGESLTTLLGTALCRIWMDYGTFIMFHRRFGEYILDTKNLAYMADLDCRFDSSVKVRNMSL
jgi:hypothetical protein